MLNKDGFIVVDHNKHVLFIDGFTGLITSLAKVIDGSANPRVTSIHGKSAFLLADDVSHRYNYSGNELAEKISIAGSASGTKQYGASSPDGSIYVRHIGSTLLVSDSDTDTVTKVLNGHASDQSSVLDISPDNEWIAIVSYSQNQAKLVKISDETEVTLGISNGLSVGWNPEGDRIYLSGWNDTKVYSWDGATGTATLIAQDNKTRSNDLYFRPLWTTNSDFFITENTASLYRYDKDFNPLGTLTTKYADTLCITNHKTGSAILYRNNYNNSSTSFNTAYFLPNVDDFRLSTLVPIGTSLDYVDTWYGEYKYKVDFSFTDNSEETEFKALVYDLGDNIVARKNIPSGTTSTSIEVPTPEPVKVVISGIPDKFHQTNHDYEVNDIIIVNDTNRSYICTTAGTTDVTKPAYPDTSGATITDGTAIFTERGKLAQPVVIYPINPTLI